MTAGGVPGEDHPEERGLVELLLSDRGVVLVSWVERLEGKEMVVTAGRDRNQRSVRLDVGDRVEVVWKGAGELRALPTRLVAVEGAGSGTCWRLVATGPAGRGQRRAAVRAAIALPVTATHGGTTLTGTTVDISEGGMRAAFRPPAAGGTRLRAVTRSDGLPAAPGDGDAPAAGVRAFGVGDVLDVVVQLGAGQLAAQVETIRVHRREDECSELSVRFIGLSEKDQDAVRARVFAGLRELRQRGLL
ncbi:PilZ domain-containing protein [Modestobacter sp. VKM Ac-2984]|uniref:PilZ domain-containing protein n=1 Tax=Modestobacter sp. VKM Ac-2984 TaxID=3004138 RepID=UPI0022AA68A0|nr:PilZ domain-containing protein [Modestobacter sp. VKM Ac-2984]MCZ2815839.1 PilZ domain-containing protein [Modestobacter sp. VKM Ac-2984]